MKSSTEKTLVLSKDVKNPKPDRRYKRDWRYEPVWKKGTKFVVKVETDQGFLDRCKTFGCEPTEELKAIARHTRIRKRGDSYAYEMVARKDDPRGQALLVALRPAKKDIKDVLGEYASPDWGGGPAAVIQQLVNNGTITFGQVERAVAELDPDHTVLDSIVMATADEETL